MVSSDDVFAHNNSTQDTSELDPFCCVWCKAFSNCSVSGSLTTREPYLISVAIELQKAVQGGKGVLTNPQHLGFLLLFQLGKEPGSLLLSLDGPSLVLTEQLLRETAGFSRDGWKVARVHLKVCIITGMYA